MENKKELDSIGKGVCLLMASAVLIETAGKLLKKENSIYKYKNKQLIDNFLRANVALIEKRKLLKNLIIDKDTLSKSSEIVGYELEADAVEDSFNIEQDLLIKMVFSYINTTSDIELNNNWIIINELFEKRKVYTKGDLLHKIEVAIKDFCNITEINKELLTKYI